MLIFNSCHIALCVFSLEGFQVVQLGEVISTADIIVTCTGNFITSPARDSGGAKYCFWCACLSVTPCT